MENQLDQPMQQVEHPAMVRVHSMVRSRHTRLQRYQAPQHHSFKQYIMGGRRLVRNRHITVTWEHMLRHLPELIDRTRKGMLECRTLAGQKINIEALQGSAAQVLIEQQKPAPATPHPPLDSAANDKPSGTPIPAFIGGAASTDPAADRAAERLAAEKQEEAERKGASTDDEQELEQLLAEDRAEDAFDADQQGPAETNEPGPQAESAEAGAPVESAESAGPTSEPAAETSQPGQQGKKRRR